MAKAFERAEDIAKGYLLAMDNPFVTGTLLDIEGGALITESSRFTHRRLKCARVTCFSEAIQRTFL